MGYLSRAGREELLFLDTHEERFSLVDGDSLLLDACRSKTWRNKVPTFVFFSLKEQYCVLEGNYLGLSPCNYPLAATKKNVFRLVLYDILT